MKKLFIIMALVMTIFFTKANTIQANDFAENTGNSRIAASLYMLNDLGQRDVIAILKGQNATGKPIRIMFRNLDIYGCGDCEAFTTKTQGQASLCYTVPPTSAVDPLYDTVLSLPPLQRLSVSVLLQIRPSVSL